MKKKILLTIVILISSNNCFAQTDSLYKNTEFYGAILDSLNLTVKEIFVEGNKITKEEIILRELSLKKGEKFTIKKLEKDLINLYRLDLFTKADIQPFPIGNNEVIIHVVVQEKFYIIPLPKAGIEDGEWKKIWIGASVDWKNFRGRNETLSAYVRIFYNPRVTLSYTIPWIGKDLHLFTTISGEYSRKRNNSLVAVGKESGGNALTFEDVNFENFRYSSYLTVGKYLTHNFNIFTEYGFDYLEVSEYADGRTLSPTGIDKYLTLGLGSSYNTKNSNAYATDGYYFRAEFLRYGLLNKEIDFGRLKLDAETYIPFYNGENLLVTAATRLYTSFAVGAVIPYYNHEYLGYSENYVRGWKKTAYEGENTFQLYNEFRFPIISPRYLSGKDVPFVRDVKWLERFYLKYGLFFTMFYDIGSVWDKHLAINKARFLNGAGIGLNFWLPFDYIVRLEWAARLSKPVVGQFGFSLSAKF